MSFRYPTSEIICLCTNFIANSCIDECNLQFIFLILLPKHKIKEWVSGSRLDIRSLCAVSAYYFRQLLFHCDRVRDRWKFLQVKVLYFEKVHDLMSEKAYLNNLALFCWHQIHNLMTQAIFKQKTFLIHYFSIYGRLLLMQKTQELYIQELSRPKFNASE